MLSSCSCQTFQFFYIIITVNVSIFTIHQEKRIICVNEMWRGDEYGGILKEIFVASM